jgi:adenosylmethionine-8-amino-7-oxononanoate aminotransferase
LGVDRDMRMEQTLVEPSTHLYGTNGGPVQAFYFSPKEGRKPTVARGEGIYLWDMDGKRYLDASSGPVICNIGHGNRTVIEAMYEQARKVSFAPRVFFENAPNVELSDLVTGLAGVGLERAFTVSGGSEATEAAIKLARQYAVVTGQSRRRKVLARNPSYHGSTLGACAVSGDPESDAMFGDLFRVMPKIPAPSTYRVPEGHTTESYTMHCASALEQQIIEEGPETVLAFIMEPVGGLATGALISHSSYYSAIRQICDRYDVLLIYDEVMCGAGRTGKFLAADHWPSDRPDIVILAKGIAAGYSPLGMVLASREMVEVVASSGGFQHGHTYASNPVSCAAGAAVIKEMLRQDLISNAAVMGRLLQQKLFELMARSNIVGDVRGKGLLNAIEIVADKETKRSFPSEHRAIQRIQRIGIDNGILLYSRRTANGAHGEWLMVTPPLTITADEIDELVSVLEKTLKGFEVAGRNPYNP